MLARDDEFLEIMKTILLAFLFPKNAHICSLQESINIVFLLASKINTYFRKRK